MKQIDRLCLILALLLVIVLRSAYMSGLYYDPDEAFSAATAIHFFDPHNLVFLLRGITAPGLAFIYHLAFSAFGVSFISIQLFALFFNLCSVFLLYYLAKHLLAQEMKFYYFLPILYALFSVSEALQGYSANKEIFLSPFEIGAILCLGLASRQKRGGLYLLSGFLLGAAFFIKQSSFAFFVAGLAFILAAAVLSKDPPAAFFKKSFSFAGAFLSPLLCLWLLFACTGSGESLLKNKIMLIFKYGKNIAAIREVYLSWAWGRIWSGIKIEIIIFGVLALIGLIFSFARFRKPGRLLILCWFLLPVFVISRSGFHFRHHFIEVLAPFLALSLAGASDAYEGCRVLMQRKKVLKLTGAALGIFILTFPYIHALAPLIKEKKWAGSFFLTERYLKDPDKERYIPLLLKESGDGAKRFLAAQYIKAHTASTDKIFVWDDIDGGAIFLWSGMDPYPFRVVSKSSFLPDELTLPIDVDLPHRRSGFRHRQEVLMQRMMHERPLYVIIVKRYALRPNAPFSPDQQLFLERMAFKELFDFIDKNYILETQLYGCEILRLINQ